MNIKKTITRSTIVAMGVFISFSVMATGSMDLPPPPPIHHISVMKIYNFSSSAYHWAGNNVMDAGQVSGTQQGTFSVKSDSGEVNFYNDYDKQAITVGVYNGGCNVKTHPPTVHVTAESDGVKTCTMTISS